ncbi:hypothetical protein F7725_022774 [Dissostichus mawsoni]|uniref:Protein tyrosine phosphatase domain-containing protein 1 n=1 Tax=Dissostichus mawsoni TaxID=36200 RepID=A0A7J5Z0Y5_DISMA|nr:hypothetical protein F7725_022774 [Dissostichus mawsoni]
MLACGGIGCRYEGPECWKLNQQVIRGIFSSWVTDDIIAMARPSSHLIKKYKIIEQFQRLNIRSIINMQLPGEHAHCGPPIEPDSGFTYSPQTFMDNDIYFYNFGMQDFNASSLVGLIDGVKVLAFAMREGRVAVHCHAGLGRSGVLIACYLIYTLRISPSEAVHYVRIKRPHSIQTRAQLSQVFDFARLLGSQLVQYPDPRLRHGDPFNLQQHLNRQAILLHGQEARTLKQTPKVVYLLCVYLSCLALGLPAPPEIQAELDKRSALRTLSRTVRESLVSKQCLPLLRECHQGPRVSLGSVSFWDEPLGFLTRKREVLQDKRSYSDSDLSKIADLELSPYCNSEAGNERQVCVKDLTQPDLRPASPILASIKQGLQTTKWNLKHSTCHQATTLNRNLHNPGPASVAVAKALADHCPPEENILQRSALLQEELNSSDCGWALLLTESDPQEPVLSAEDVDRLCCGANQRKPLSVLKKPQRDTISCLLSCVSTVTSLCPHREDAVLQRLVQALTRCPHEETSSLATLMKVLKASLRETSHSYL